MIIRIDYCTLALILFRSYFHAGNKFVFVFAGICQLASFNSIYYSRLCLNPQKGVVLSSLLAVMHSPEWIAYSTAEDKIYFVNTQTQGLQLSIYLFATSSEVLPSKSKHFTISKNYYIIVVTKIDAGKEDY